MADNQYITKVTVDGVDYKVRDEILTTPLFYVTAEYSTGYNFQPGQYRSLEKTYTGKSGYTPIPILVASTSHVAIDVINYYKDGSGKLIYECVNRTSNNLSGVDFKVVFLYIKTSLIGS